MAPRLDTRLSRLLLDEGRLSVEALEDAVQQQVVHGGALDTILLELGLIDEDAASGALCIAWETLPVPLEQVTRPASAATRRLPGRVAAATGICPFLDDEEGVHVLVSAPLDHALLEEVSSLVNSPLVPHVVPEVRLRQALAAAYAIPLEERYASLARLLDGEAATRPGAPSAPSAEEARAPAPADDVTEQDAQGWDVVEALAHLAAQDTREGIAQVALAWARRFLPFAAIFGVRGGMAAGWRRSGPCEGAQFESRPLAVPAGSLLEQLLENPSPQLCKPPLTDGNMAFLGWLGRRRPQTSLLIPIVVAERTVAVLYADGGVRSRDFDSMSDLVAFGARIGPAFESLLRARHRAHADLFQRAPGASAAEAAEATEPAAAQETAQQATGSAAPPPRAQEGARPSAPPAQPEAGRTAPSPRDGTSPFARGYTAPTRPPPPAPKRERPAEEETWTHQSLVIDRLSGDEATPSALATLAGKIKKPAAASPSASLDELRPPSPDEIDDWGDVDDSSGGIAGFEPDEEEVRLDTAVAVVAAKLAHAEDDAGDWREGVAGGLPKALVRSAAGSAPATDDAAEREDAADAAVAFTHLDDAWTGALAETVARGHQGGEASPDERPVLDDDGEWEDVVLDGAYARALEEPKPPPAGGPPVEPEAKARAADPTAIDELVAGLESLHPRVVAEAKAALVALGDEATAALAARFPGRLLTDPFALDEPPESAAELGPLVEVLAGLGPAGLDAAIPHLDARYPAHRYVATWLFLAVPDERCLDVLRPRLHDSEPKIRRIAAEALSHFMAHPRFEPLLVQLRERVGSPMPEARQRAIWLLGFFRDVGAVPLLIKQLDERNTLVVDAARAALRQIALQDLEPKSKIWLKWWEKARKRSRIDWLIEGLKSRDRDLRYIASTELSRLVGTDFGYRCDDPKRARDAAVKRYEQWWDDERAKLVAGV